MSQDRRRILYCGAFRFPAGDAAALRVMSIGKSFRVAGREVEFISWNTPDHEHLSPRLAEGFTYRTVGEMRGGKVPLFGRLAGFLTRGRKTMDYLRTIDTSDVEAIICYNSNSFFVASLRNFCRERSIEFVVDCTEWYEASHLPGGRFGPAALDEWIRMRVLAPRTTKAIVISEYLQDYFRKFGVKTALVPPTIDMEDEKWRVANHRFPTSPDMPLMLVYAGNPGKKDRIEDILEAVLAASGGERPVSLRLVGPTALALRKLLGARSGLVDALGERLTFTGRVPAAEVPGLVGACHFSMILRPRARYAAAGFPTKLVESLAVGVPVICSTTGDEGKYVRDGETGFTVKGLEHSSLASVLLKAASLTSSDWQRMSRASRYEAARAFDYHVHVGPLSALLDAGSTGVDH